MWRLQRVMWATALLLSRVAAGQEFIGGPDFDASDVISTNAPHWNLTATPAQTVDGSGLDPTGEMHAAGSYMDGIHWLGSRDLDAGPGGDGLPNPGTHQDGSDPAGWIRFDLDKVYVLGELRVWNYNSANSNRGMNKVIIEYSLTGGPDQSEWIRLGGSGKVFSFLEAPNDDSYTGFIAADFGDVSARSVVFTARDGQAGVANFDGTSGLGLSEVRFYLGEERPPPQMGDADEDGDIDDDDLSLLLAHWGQDVSGDSDGGWGKGELSGLPPINDDDLSLLLAHWTGPQVGALPEPATGALLMCGGAVMLRRRRRP